MNSIKPYYAFGIDAPPIILAFGIAAFFLFSLSFIFYVYDFSWLVWVILSALAVYSMINAILMLISSLWGKIRQAEVLITLLSIKGHEKVLDVGCGRGLLLIKMAQKLTTGNGAGLDIWSQTDQWKNSKDNTRKNIEIAGLGNTISLIDGDARALPFKDNTFDIVTSSLVVHNLATAHDRKTAIQEMVRVLVPGGTLLIQDFQYTNDYFNIMKQLNLVNVKRSKLYFNMFPPVRIVTATKNSIY